MYNRFSAWLIQPWEETKPSPTLNILFFAVVAALLSLLFFLRLNVKTNDDIFTYFNYARNMAEGRFFAIDYRNIPGEGFSSMLYMLLLVPFHMLGTNPMLAGVLLNFVALFGCLYITALIMEEVFGLSELGKFFAFAILGCLAIRHPDIISIVGVAFETIYSPLFLSALLLLSVRLSKQEQPRARHILAVGLYACGVLTRPENALLYMPVMACYAFVFWPNWKQVAILAMYGAGFIVLLAIFKWVVFHDLYPTGYYRKFSNIDYGVASGTQYVRNWANSHIGEIVVALSLLTFIMIAGLGAKRFKGDGIQPLWPLFASMLLVLVLNIAFVAKTTPLVGYSFRYLILANYVILFGVASAVILFFKYFFGGSVLNAMLYSRRAMIVTSFLFLLLLIGNLFRGIGTDAALAKLDILAIVRKQVEIHPYLKFGNYLRTHLPDHKKLVISMEDGGAVPYAAECNTIDPAGLTEPFVARLAAYTGNDRWQVYYTYLQSYKPDLLVMNMVTVGNALDTTDECSFISHKAVPPQDFVRYLKRIGKEGYVYVSTISSDSAGVGMAYDQHLIVNIHSPMAKLLIKTCQDYSATWGYTMVGNYTITCSEIVAVLPKYRL